VGGAIPHAYLKARLQQVARHRRTHGSDAENRDPLSHQPVTVSAEPVEAAPPCSWRAAEGNFRGFREEAAASQCEAGLLLLFQSTTPRARRLGGPRAYRCSRRFAR